MSDTLAGLRRKIDGAGDLESVVRSMKALAAASIGQYEKSVLALADYYRTVELGLVVCLRNHRKPPQAVGFGLPPHERNGLLENVHNQVSQVGIHEVTKRSGNAVMPVNAVVFGSDQGLVGQFNDQMADFAAKTLHALPG